MSFEAPAARNEQELTSFIQMRLVEFVRLARNNNFRVGVAEEGGALHVAGLIEHGEAEVAVSLHLQGADAQPAPMRRSAAPWSTNTSRAGQSSP